MSMTAARRAVQKGATLLDQKNPGWHNEIDLTSLNMALTSSCVLGLLYGNFFKGARALGLDDTSNEVGREYGYDIGADDVMDYDELDRAWIDLINERIETPVSNISMTVTDHSSEGEALVSGSVTVGGKEILLPDNTPLSYLLKLIEVNR